ncbi:hypothetical protein BpHYR1_053230 [Brachionus plicatilis]|uniref:Uncharacterized protein n=1 Tax=Brachionus plicatilis TaxID=10195 RepID=A0A3M7SH85_BRAPC|nr:hypothetical protein BpHYR1_053230 [Brachionus plicatilis]
MVRHEMSVKYPLKTALINEVNKRPGVKHKIYHKRHNLFLMHSHCAIHCRKISHFFTIFHIKYMGQWFG